MFAEHLVDRTERRRQLVSEKLDHKHRSKLGQFFTPAPVADFLAGLFDLPEEGTMRLLDPGAGVGSLTAAVVARVIRERPRLGVEVVAFELDEALIPHLSDTLRDCEQAGDKAGVTVTTDLRQDDFVAWASASLCGSLFVPAETFAACVMNPPYRKVNNGGADRLALERVGVRVTNLYTAFLVLAAALLEPGGQLSTITPRSFANGPYFMPFRGFFLSRMALDRVHVYEQRGRVFADVDVLQENVVFRATRDGEREAVLLSTSVGYEDEPVIREVPYADVVRPGDPRLFVRLPVDEEDRLIADQIADLPSTLEDLDVQVSTGRVVDFRAREHLRPDPGIGTVPLIYPGHIRDTRIVWPQPGSKKPNALAANEETQAMLLPNGVYVVVKRFTAKEERRRVVAALSSPEDVPGKYVAFENHLNVYHRAGRGLRRELALGLVAFLNSTPVDMFVRQFSGHTQINATDLWQLRYPSVDELTALGHAVEQSGWAGDQEQVDELVARHVAAFGHVSGDECSVGSLREAQYVR